MIALIINYMESKSISLASLQFGASCDRQFLGEYSP